MVPHCGFDLHFSDNENLHLFLFLFSCCWPHPAVCGISVLWPGIEPGPWQWKSRILTTRQPGKFPQLFLLRDELYFPILCMSSLTKFLWGSFDSVSRDHGASTLLCWGPWKHKAVLSGSCWRTMGRDAPVISPWPNKASPNQPASINSPAYVLRGSLWLLSWEKLLGGQRFLPTWPWTFPAVIYQTTFDPHALEFSLSLCPKLSLLFLRSVWWINVELMNEWRANLSLGTWPCTSQWGWAPCFERREQWHFTWSTDRDIWVMTVLSAGESKMQSLALSNSSPTRGDR